MTDARPRLDAALHTLDRLKVALHRCHTDAHSPLAARAHTDRVTGTPTASLPHLAEPALLDAYTDAVALIDAAQDTAHRLGWPTRAVWPNRIPEPWQVDSALSILRSAVRLFVIQQVEGGLVLKLCGQIEGALAAIPRDLWAPAVKVKPAAKRCANDTCNSKPVQRSDFCSSCRDHRRRKQADRVVGAQGACVGACCQRRKGAA